MDRWIESYELYLRESCCECGIESPDALMTCIRFRASGLLIRLCDKCLDQFFQRNLGLIIRSAYKYSDVDVKVLKTKNG